MYNCTERKEIVLKGKSAKLYYDHILQLLETGFLAIWIVPFLTWRSLPECNPSPWIAVVFYRWLIMRIMLGAGLIKIRGDRCWIDLTCKHLQIGGGEKRRRYVGFRYVIRVFLMVFFSTLTYLRRYVRVFFIVCRAHNVP